MASEGRLHDCDDLGDIILPSRKYADIPCDLIEQWKQHGIIQRSNCHEASVRSISVVHGPANPVRVDPLAN
eukprot:30648-Eustigmatos_ZCMA.PRE.1